MRINKILIVLFYPFIITFVISCCECIDTIIDHYTNKAIEINIIDNTGSRPVITFSDSVLKEAFGIRVELTRDQTAYLNPAKSIFIESAFATSCDCPPDTLFFARDSIVTIQVFTLKNFDENHPENSDITDYFKVYKDFLFYTITDYIQRYNSTLYSFSELDLTFDALLLTPPTINKSHSFKLKLILSDGRIIEGITSPIDLI